MSHFSAEPLLMHSQYLPQFLALDWISNKLSYLYLGAWNAHHHNYFLTILSVRNLTGSISVWPHISLNLTRFISLWPNIVFIHRKQRQVLVIFHCLSFQSETAEYDKKKALQKYQLTFHPILWVSGVLRQGRPQRIRYLRISVGSVSPDDRIELFPSFQGVFEFWKSGHY